MNPFKSKIIVPLLEAELKRKLVDFKLWIPKENKRSTMSGYIDLK